MRRVAASSRSQTAWNRSVKLRLYYQLSLPMSGGTGQHRRAGQPDLGAHWRPIMFKNILIATDGSELAEKAVQQGLAIAKDMSAKATVVRATPVPRMFVAEGVMITPPVGVQEQVAKVVADQFTNIKKQASAVGVPCEYAARRERHTLARNSRRCKGKGMRSDRDGVTRPDRLFPRRFSAAKRRKFLRNQPFLFSSADDGDRADTAAALCCRRQWVKGPDPRTWVPPRFTPPPGVSLPTTSAAALAAPRVWPPVRASMLLSLG